MNPHSETPPPSWQVFAECEICNAKIGEPCVSRRDIRTLNLPRNECRELTAAHPGRKQIEPKAGRSFYLR
jgi:hypothetical protein